MGVRGHGAGVPARAGAAPPARRRRRRRGRRRSFAGSRASHQRRRKLQLLRSGLSYRRVHPWASQAPRDAAGSVRLARRRALGSAPDVSRAEVDRAALGRWKRGGGVFGRFRRRPGRMLQPRPRAPFFGRTSGVAAGLLPLWSPPDRTDQNHSGAGRRRRVPGRRAAGRGLGGIMSQGTAPRRGWRGTGRSRPCTPPLWARWVSLQPDSCSGASEHIVRVRASRYARCGATLLGPVLDNSLRA